MRIGVVAPSTPIGRDVADRVLDLAAREFPEAELVFHPQCFLAHRHFAGEDQDRAAAFAAFADDPAFDAIWFARGGYGSCRIAEAAIARLHPAARDKTFLGYSDAGFVLAGLHRAGFAHLAHGPMVNDLGRADGEAAVRRALAWLVRRDPASLEPGLGGAPSAAFNITVFSQLLGTALQPDIAGQMLLLEDVSEYMYSIDRSMFHITSNPDVRRAAGIRLGRVSAVPVHEPDFVADEEEVVRYWCERSAIPFLGRAEIGHDAANRVVPFGRAAAESGIG